MMDDTMEPAMELDDLKAAWKTLDRKLELDNALRLAELRDRKAERMRHSLRPLARGQSVQMLFGTAAMLLGAACWARHLDIGMMVACGLVVHAYGLAVMIASGVVIGMARAIDLGEPVMALQLRLARLRKAYLVSGRIAGLPWWVMWMPMLVVLAGLENPDRLPPGPMPVATWIWSTLAVGALGLAATWGLHRWAHQPQRAELGRRIDDHFAGNALRRAQAQLDELVRFERD
jgi:hypothetical protein